MANELTGSLLQSSNIEQNITTAVVYFRGFGNPDSGVKAALADAAGRGCSMTLKKNERLYNYENGGEVETSVSYCYTDDEGITKHYENAGIPVIQIAPMTPEEIEALDPVKQKQKKMEAVEAERSIESIKINTKIEAENAALKRRLDQLEAQMQSNSKPAASENQQEKEKEAPKAQENKTLGLGKKSGA